MRALTPCAMSQEVSATSSFPVDANMDARAADPGKQARLRRSVRALTPGAMSQEVMYIIYIYIYSCHGHGLSKHIVPRQDAGAEGTVMMDAPLAGGVARIVEARCSVSDVVYIYIYNRILPFPYGQDPDSLPLCGFILDNEWIDLILTGQKTWEVRGEDEKKRGRVGSCAAHIAALLIVLL